MSSMSTQPRQSGGVNVFMIAVVCLLIVLIGLGTFAVIAQRGGASPQPSGAGIYDMPTKF
jgi:hypothetical protein